MPSVTGCSQLPAFLQAALLQLELAICLVLHDNFN
jgi:hypothetical protein